MHLSKNKKNSSQFFCRFFKSTSNFEHFRKKMTFIPDVCPKYGLRKKWLDKCLKRLGNRWLDKFLKRLVSEDPRQATW